MREANTTEVSTADGPTVSASQINDWLKCNRYWGFASHLRLPKPKWDSAGAGKRVHKILENYLKADTAQDIDRAETWRGTGKKVYKVGAIATAMARDLPARGSVAPELVESHFVITPDGIRIQGYRDLIRHGYVRDHKTTSDLKWAKSDLSVDVQAIIYANSMFAEDLADDSVECEWGYGQTKGAAKTLLVTHTFSEDAALNALYEHVLPPARELIHAKLHLPVTKEAVNSLDANLDACEAMGGCPFRGDCNRSIKQRYVAIMNKQSALDRLRAKRAGVTIDPVQTTAVEGKVVITNAAPDAVVSTVSPTPDAGVTQVSTAVTDPTLTVVQDLEMDANRYEFTSAVPPVDLGPVEPGITLKPSSEHVHATREESPNAVAPTRKRRSKINPVSEANPPEGAVAPPAAGPRHEILTYQPLGAPDTAPRLDFTLYVGCQPTKESCTYLHDLIPFVAAQVEAAIEKPHWSLAEYGAGKGLLAAGLREYLERTGLTGGLVVKFQHCEESRAVLGVLVHMAKEVVVA